MFRWLMRYFGSREGYRRGYKRGLARARADAYAARQVASDRCEEILAEATRRGQEIERECKERGRRVGHQEGWDEGHAKGQRQGVAYGQDLGLIEACRELGIVTTKSAADLIEEHQHADLVLNWGVHANVYHCRDHALVKIIVNGEMQSKRFNYGVQKDGGKRALLEAVRWRNQHLPQEHNGSEALWSECCQAVFDPWDPRDGLLQHEALRVALEFHRRLLQTDLRIARVLFLGEDPEDRLGIENTSVLFLAWPTLYKKVPKKIAYGLEAIGLGNPENPTNPPRTIRDLLMFSEDEIMVAIGIGRVAINDLKSRLLQRGLVLWGEAPPISPTARGTNYRSIQLERDE